MITQTFDLNLIPDSSPVVVHCDQYDTGAGRLIAKLYDESVAYSPSGTAVIQGRKPDGNGFQYSATLSGNTVTADLTAQMTAVAGRVETQIVVTESSGRTGTFVFALEVQKSALPADTDMSDSAYESVKTLLDEVEQITPTMQGYVTAAEGYADESEGWAKGTHGGVPVPPTDPAYQNNSKYWSDVASQYAQGGLHYMGSCTFANIPTTGMNRGDMWNIEDDFTTDNRFQEGAGIKVSGGTNIAWNQNNKWDVLAASGGDFVGLYGKVEVTSANADLNSYTTAGTYYRTNTSFNVVNYPFNATEKFLLIVQKPEESGNVIEQTFLGESRFSMRTSTDGGSTWGSWVKYAADSKFAYYQKLYDGGSITSGTDLNDCTNLGNYLKYGTDFVPLHAPTAIVNTDRFLLINYRIAQSSGSTDSTFQLMYVISADGSTSIYSRGRRSSSDSWYAWSSGGGGVTGDYMGLYGLTEIQSSDGQGTTAIDLDTYTTVGNYYCHGKGKITLQVKQYINAHANSYVTSNISNAEFLLYVRRLENNTLIQDIYVDKGQGSYLVGHRIRYYLNSQWNWDPWSMDGSIDPSNLGRQVLLYLGELADVITSSLADGDILCYNSTSTFWENKPINKVTSFAVGLTGWTSDTTSQSGTTLYKKTISLTHVYVSTPTVDIGSSGVLPTKAQQESYNLLQYATVDDTVPCLYLYASAIPTTAFYIKVKGVE